MQSSLQLPDLAGQGRTTPHPSQGVCLACFLTAELDGPLGQVSHSQGWKPSRCPRAPRVCALPSHVDLVTKGTIRWVFSEPQEEPAGP